MGLPVLRALSLCTCCRHYPGAATGRRRRSSRPAVSAFPENVVGSACTSSFSRLARRSLALRPAHSRSHLYVTSYTAGFSHFVTSMTAPVASGWSVRRVGSHPLESAAFSRRTRQADVADGAPWDVAFGVPAVVPRSPKQRFVAPVVWWGANVGRARGLGAGWGARGDAMASAIDGSVLKPLVAIPKDDGPRLTVTVSGTSPHWSPRPQRDRPPAAACLALVSGRPRAPTPSRPDGPRRYVQRGSPASGCRCARDP